MSLKQLSAMGQGDHQSNQLVYFDPLQQESTMQAASTVAPAKASKSKSSMQMLTNKEVAEKAAALDR